MQRSEVSSAVDPYMGC